MACCAVRLVVVVAARRLAGSLATNKLPAPAMPRRLTGGREDEMTLVWRAGLHVVNEPPTFVEPSKLLWVILLGSLSQQTPRCSIDAG